LRIWTGRASPTIHVLGFCIAGHSSGCYGEYLRSSQEEWWANRARQTGQPRSDCAGPARNRPAEAEEPCRRQPGWHDQSNTPPALRSNQMFLGGHRSLFPYWISFDFGQSAARSKPGAALPELQHPAKFCIVPDSGPSEAMPSQFRRWTHPEVIHELRGAIKAHWFG
jgi:hypothetical protein